MASQMKAFFDSTGQLWQGGALVGKPAAFFVSTACQGGGQEVTVLTSVTQLAAHGMIFVPLGFSFGAAMFGLDEVQGGSAWGAGTFAGATGARQPTEHELGLAKHQVRPRPLPASYAACFQGGPAAADQVPFRWDLLERSCNATGLRSYWRSCSA
jgi:multimeric flavodoxin WrbA